MERASSSEPPQIGKPCGTGAVESYRTFLEINEYGDGDPKVADARSRLAFQHQTIVPQLGVIKPANENGIIS